MRLIRNLVTKAATRLVAYTDRAYVASVDPLLRGDLVAYAESEYPREKYPTAWVDIPDDLRRPLIWDGRLLNGRYVAELAKADLRDSQIVTALVKSGVRAFIVCLILGAILAVPFAGTLRYALSAPTPYPMWAADAGAWLPVVSWYLLAAINAVWVSVALSVKLVWPLVALFPVIWFFAFCSAMNFLWSRVSSRLRAPTRDTALFWKSNLATRQLQYTAYCREVDNATDRLKDQPIIAVGTASGTIRSRGDMEAPAQGQLVAYDGESIRQHTLVLGGTGSGKTRLVMRPLFKRIMSADWGSNHKIGCYITDGKGTLWKDLAPMVADRKDVAILGTDEGQFGIDLVQGMSPLEISTTFKAVGGQVAGKPSDDFWPESASLLLMHAATVARMLQKSEATVAEWIEKRSITPYSLLGIALLASEEKAAREAFEAVKKVGRDLAPTMTPEDENHLDDAMNSIEWLNGSFLPMANETKSSIIANVNVVLGKLQGAREISRRFCSGNFAQTVDVDHALKGGVLFVSVGETEHGMAGKVVNTWLKTRLYIMARRRLLDDPEGCRNTSCALFADEFQMLATTGPDSDSTFWNIARETGVFLIAATQSLAALKQVIGEDAMSNLVNLLRSKIVLKTEELSTLNFVRQIAGDAPRGWEYEEGFYATQTAREMDIGNFNDEITAVLLKWSAGLWPKRYATNTAPNSAYYIDKLMKGVGKSDSRDSSNSLNLSLSTRFEDKNRAEMVEGVQHRPKLDFDELLLGSGMAFAIVQRAGGDRMDIIDLERAA